MTHRDPYDPIVAFDDLYDSAIDTDAGAFGGEVEEQTALMMRSAESADYVFGLLGEHVRKMRLSPPPMTFEILGCGDTTRSFALPSSVVGGAGYYVAGGDLPIFDGLAARFGAAMPSRKAVRLDTEGSYLGFRGDRLEARLSALESAFSAHLADGHGGGLHETLGTVIELPLPPWAAGKIDCWREGSEILCTIRIPGADGTVRCLTTATSLVQPIDEVLGAGIAYDLHFEDVYPHLLPLAEVLGGERLIPELCGVAPAALAAERRYRSVPLVGTMGSLGDPTVAAAMALVQRCQGGDAAACAELARLAEGGQKKLVKIACKRLARGQQEKSRSRS